LKDHSAAARYAKALFLITEKRGETARALEDLNGLRPAFAAGGRIQRFLVSPETRLQDKRDVLRKGFQGRIAPLVAVFLDLLLRKKRIADYATVADEFEALVEKALGIQRARVVSAVPLEPAEMKRLHEALERTTRSHIKLTSEIDAELLGGALVRIGDRVVDRSVRTLLEAIEKRLYAVSV
jgi:F-type H+-transporting ATPase subunit delta